MKSSLSPPEVNLLLERSKWLVKARWITIGSLILLGVFTKLTTQTFPASPFFTLAAIILLINAGFTFVIRKQFFSVEKTLLTRSILDILILTIALYFSGGVNSSFCYLYFLLIFSISISCPLKHSLFFATISTFSYLLIMLFTRLNFLYPYYPLELMQSNQIIPLSVKGSFTIFLFYLSVLSGQQAFSRIRRQNRELKEAVERKEKMYQEVNALYQEVGKQMELAHQNLAFMKNFSETVLEEINIGVLIIDTQNIITVWNEALEKITGIKKKEIIGRSFLRELEFMGGDFISAVRDSILTGKQVVLNNYKIENLQNKIFHLSIFPLRDNTADFTLGTSVVFEDITQNIDLKEKFLKTHQHLEKRIAELSIINEFSKLISSTLNYQQVSELTLDLVTDKLKANGGFYYTYDEELDEFIFQQGKELKNFPQKVKNTPDHIYGWVAQERKTVLINDFANSPLGVKLKEGEEFSSYLCSPLISQNVLLGVIGVFCRDGRQFSSADKELFHILSQQTAAVIDNVKLYENIQKNYLSTIKSLSEAVEAKDAYTQGHSARVTTYAIEIINALPVKEKEKVEIINHLAILHDIGKIGVPANILNKAGKLTEEEYEMIKKHPVMGEKIIEPLNLLKEAREMIKYHHEKYDGSGYPEGLRGEKIPFLARILAVADAFDAMTSTRPYRKSLSEENALRELEAHKGTQFDPQIVEAFIRGRKKKKELLENPESFVDEGKR